MVLGPILGPLLISFGVKIGVRLVATAVKGLLDANASESAPPSRPGEGFSAILAEASGSARAEAPAAVRSPAAGPQAAASPIPFIPLGRLALEGQARALALSVQTRKVIPPALG